MPRHLIIKAESGTPDQIWMFTLAGCLVCQPTNSEAKCTDMRRAAGESDAKAHHTKPKGCLGHRKAPEGARGLSGLAALSPHFAGCVRQIHALCFEPFWLYTGRCCSTCSKCDIRGSIYLASGFNPETESTGVPPHSRPERRESALQYELRISDARRNP